jgi:hypothetical protein
MNGVTETGGIDRSSQKITGARQMQAAKVMQITRKPAGEPGLRR